MKVKHEGKQHGDSLRGEKPSELRGFKSGIRFTLFLLGFRKQNLPAVFSKVTAGLCVFTGSESKTKQVKNKRQEMHSNVVLNLCLL